MANNFDGVYSGGAVTFNSTPYVQMYQQIKARNDAKQTAIDNYYRDLSKTLTPAGMAANDVEDFNGKVNQWRDFVTQNRQVLSNPRDPNYGKALNQAGYLYNDALGHADESKRKVADADRFNQLRLSHPEYAITDNGMMAFDKSMKPVSKGGGNLDWSAVAYNPKDKPYTNDDLVKYQTSLGSRYKMSEGKPVFDKDKAGNRTVTTTSSYNPKDLSGMASDVHVKYNSDMGFKGYIDNLAKDPALYEQMNQKFKSIYGQDYNIKHPEEFAEMIALPQTSTTDTKPYVASTTNPYEELALRKDFYDYTHTQQQLEINNTIDEDVDKQIEEAKQGKQWGAPAELSVDPATLKSMGISKALLSPDGTKIIPVTDLVTGTKPDGTQIVTPTNGTPVTIEQWKNAMGKRNIGAKYFQKGGGGTQTSTKKSSSKVYTLINPNTGEVVGTVDSEEEANKAAKKGYKVN